jgi:hypothetical protein
MSTELQTRKSFSIFNPSIRYEHREFYEKILSELNGIFPICNQGECTAVEISESTTEQEQITELMKRVENFSSELLDVTKKLFDQYYVAKEELHQSILSTTAYNKINTLDRNLLERTCDVRWWALETAFSDCISFYERTKENALHLAGSINEPDGAMDAWRSSEGAAGTSRSAPLQDMLPFLTNFEVLLRKEKLEGFLDLIEVLPASESTDGSGASDPLSEEIKAFGETLRTLGQKITFACDRLEDINNSYTLYRDLIIAGRDGYVIANSNKARRDMVLGLNVNGEKWFQRALMTKNGAEYFALDITPSSVEDQLSLVYSTAVRENSDENGKTIGAMGVFFDFQGEAGIILEEYMPRDERENIVDGCYSMFTNRAGEVIASSDETILKVGESAHIPKRNRQLGSGERVSSYMVFEGIDSAVFSAKTDGYLDYKGLEWSSHVIIPKDYIFNTTVFSETLGISPEELMSSKIIPEINKQTYLKVQDDKESIQLISLNGIVFASKLGKRGAALGPIFNQITRTGDFVTSRMEDLLKEMALGELDLNLKALENFSKQAIDLIDRNLFERSADIRWWSTDQYFWKALMNPSEEYFRKAGERLKVINGSYTMYRNLVLADSRGEIVACSRTEMRNELKKINVSDQYWFQQGMRTPRSSEYAVQDVAKSNLEKTKDRSLIYSGGVRSDGAREGESIGVLGILFDWDTEAQKILCTCLPRDPNGAQIEGSAAFYTNKNGEIIETTHSENFPVGLKLQGPKPIMGIGAGESVSGILDFNGVQYIIGSSKAKGYREYEGLEWSAHIVRPVY